MQCFKCGDKGHKKWKCPKMKERKRKKEVTPPQEVWKKVKEHCGARRLSLRGTVMSMEGWTMQ